MRDARAVMHVGIANQLRRGNVPGIPGACAPAILCIWQEAHAVVLGTNVFQLLLENKLVHVETEGGGGGGGDLCTITIVRGQKQGIHIHSKRWPRHTQLKLLMHSSP